MYEALVKYSSGRAVNVLRHSHIAQSHGLRKGQDLCAHAALARHNTAARAVRVKLARQALQTGPAYNFVLEEEEGMMLRRQQHATWVSCAILLAGGREDVELK